MKLIFEENPKKKGRCPQCGKPRSFRYYEGLDRVYGRCERINNCNYFNKPNIQMIEFSRHKVAKSPVVRIIYPNETDYLHIISDTNSKFHRICKEKLGISEDKFHKWNIGTKDELTAFAYRGRSNKLYNIKYVEYDDNCHRNKNSFPYSLKPKGRDEKYPLCLFGEHLLTDKPICIVESEKTAFIASCFYPKYDWLASGSSNGLTDNKISVLLGKEVIYIPDADNAGRSNSSIKCLMQNNIKHRIKDLFPDREDGYDLADAILDGLFPEIDPINVLQEHNLVDHKDVLQNLLLEIKPIDFREAIGLPEEKDIRQKHFIFGVVKNLLKIAKQKKWLLCKVFDYTYIYNGAYWKQCSKDDLKKFLCDSAVKMGLPDYEAKHYEFGDKLLKQFLSDAHFPTPEPDPRKILINLHNGTFEFTEQGFSKKNFNPEDFLTYQLPFDYLPEAACPLFNKYLTYVLPDKSSQLILQEFAGSIFTNLNLEKCLVLVGNGGNGKSVFFNIINALIGKENILNYSLGLFSHEYNRAKLTNVLLNYSSEKGFDLHPDIFKALISMEPLQAREPYGKPFTICNRSKFIINLNELPRETESTEAYFRRFIIVPFEVKISKDEKDISLADKIIANELPGIFNWLLVGLRRILNQKEFTFSEKAEKALGDFRKQSDSVQLFIEENQCMPSELHYEPLKDLYSRYKIFCSEDNYKALGKNRFSMRLENKGFSKIRRNTGHYFGVEMAEENVF